MSKVCRVVLVDGAAHEVACALRADGVTAPVVDLLELLESQVWPDPDAEEIPDSYQAKIKHRFLASVDHLAEFGELEDGFNVLEDGIWEIKISSLRVTFYDTPGDGTYSPKSVEKLSPWKVPFPENFDEYIRLGHHFGKTGQVSGKSNIDEAKLVRVEDLSHDRG